MTDGPVYLVHLVMDSDPTLAACTGTPWSPPRDTPLGAKFQFCEGCRIAILRPLQESLDKLAARKAARSAHPSAQEPHDEAQD